MLSGEQNGKKCKTAIICSNSANTNSMMVGQKLCTCNVPLRSLKCSCWDTCTPSWEPPDLGAQIFPYKPLITSFKCSSILVKEYRRSAAGRTTSARKELRSKEALVKTTNYLVNE